tara:strand:- start:157 stop:372 length:216 start_codon:yes stop_codon:yes gene_type:complete
MKTLTDLYQALANARKTVRDIERAIENMMKSSDSQKENMRYYTKFSNADSNGNYTREDFYRDVEREDINDK